MPALASLHPQIVHFVIALLFCGVLFRWLSFIGAGRLAFTGPAAATLLLVASGVAGLAGAYTLYQAGDKGGDLVYSYAGGVGIQSGDASDIGHLLMAGLYHQAMADRREGKSAEAAQLIGELAQRYPDDTAVRLLTVESLIVDKHDGRGALAALKWFPPAPDSRFLRFRVGLLRADAFAAAGAPDSAKLLLQTMSAEFSNNGAIRDRLTKLK